MSEMSEMTNLNTEKSIFYHKLLKIGIPVLIQQVVSVGLNLVDTIMVGKVSENALAAVGAANQIYFIYSIVIFGIFSGAAVYSVQYWGLRDIVSLRKILGIDYLMCLAVAILTVVGAWCFAPQLISLFTDEGDVIILGTKYLRIACFSYLFASLSFVITYNSRAIQDLKVPTTINAVAILVNVFLNYLLIYGKMGMPELGVEGAAYATLIARILECIAMLSSIYLRKTHPLKAGIKEMLSFSADLFKNVMKTAVPVILTEGLWAISVSLMYMAFGKISASALAITQIAVTVTDFAQTVYFSVGNAASVIVGEELGKGNMPVAWRSSKRIMKITWCLNIVMTAVILLMRGPVANIYGFDADTTAMLMKALLVYGIFMTPKMLEYMMICGIFRSGGDTVICMYVDVGMNMLVQVPLAFFSVLVLHLPLHWAMAVSNISEVIKVIWCYYRYYSKRWMNVVTDAEVDKLLE